MAALVLATTLYNQHLREDSPEAVAAAHVELRALRDDIRREFKTRGGALQRAIFLYSFGPNRQRDSTRREVRSDDLGAVLLGAVKMPPRDLGGDEEEGED